MPEHITSVLYLTTQIILVSGVILILFRLRHRFGLGLLYLFIGSNQYLQTVAASSLMYPITDDIRVSYGSVIIFSSTLFAIFLTYLQEDIPRTRSLIYGVVLSNLTLIGFAWLTEEQFRRMADLQLISGAPEIFSVSPRAFFIGTLVLIIDAFLIVIIHEVLLARAKRLPLAARMVLTLLAVLYFDALMFSIGGFWGREAFEQILVNQLTGKTLAGLGYGLILFAYIYWTQKSGEKAKRAETAEIGVFSILTYRERYRLVKQQLADSEAANLAKNRFLAHMSHELRTPLNAVIGFTNVLRKNKSGHLNDKELLYLERIFGNARHLLELINGILDLSKIESGRFDLISESFSLNQLMTETIGEMRGQALERGLELDLVLPEKVLTIETDRSALKQVLINLIGNGLKFTKEGGVSVRLIAPSEGAGWIEVEDTGIGIPEELQELIFEAFTQAESTTQRQYGGSGLGLTISKALCGQMGLRLELESTVGRGSKFQIFLN